MRYLQRELPSKAIAAELRFLSIDDKKIYLLLACTEQRAALEDFLSRYELSGNIVPRPDGLLQLQLPELYVDDRDCVSFIDRLHTYRAEIIDVILEPARRKKSQ